MNLPGSRQQRALPASGLEEAVREAGALAREAFGKPMRTWLKDKSSPVSEVDIAVDALLRDRLGSLLPDAGWLSEETEDNSARIEAHQVWIVDPIDGSRAFIAGRSDWAISVALVEAGRPVMAALYAPMSEEFFFATPGGGATRNRNPIAASEDTPSETARETARETNALRFAGPKVYAERLSATAALTIVPRIHSMALRLARVADATIDVAIAGPNSHDWDLAAADLLVHEAGGALTTIDGVAPVYNRATTVHGVLLAAGRSRHAALNALLRSPDFPPARPSGGSQA
jgi:myo-inositol-1(or 4)-monophosphatase